MPYELLVLRLVHVLGGIFWVGSALFTFVFLMPALASAGIAPAQVMAGLQRRRLFVVLPTAAVLTILSGLRLMWIVSGGFDDAYFAGASGRTFALSGLAALLAWVLGMLVSRPAMARAGRLAAQAGAADERTRAELMARAARLRRRGSMAGSAAVTLLLLGAAGMAVGRYV